MSRVAGTRHLAQTPAGALVDAVRAKRIIVAVAALVVTLTSLLLPWLPDFFPVAIRQIATGKMQSRRLRSPTIMAAAVISTGRIRVRPAEIAAATILARRMGKAPSVRSPEGMAEQPVHN